MAKQPPLRRILLWTAAAILLSIIPIGVRRLYPGLLGINHDGRDVLDEICFVAAYVRSLMVYLGVVLIPVALLLALLRPDSPVKRHRVFSVWKWVGIAVFGLWTGSFFTVVSYTNGASYFAKLDEGVVSLQWGPIPTGPTARGCLPWFEDYTRGPRVNWWVGDVFDYHYVWQIPDDLKRRTLPHFYKTATLRFLDIPLWPLVAPIVAWSIVLWQRSHRRQSQEFCPTCGYNLTGNLSGICPECAKPIPPNKPKPTPDG